MKPIKIILPLISSGHVTQKNLISFRLITIFKSIIIIFQREAQRSVLNLVT